MKSTKPVLRFKELASRLRGFSTPIFGLSWNPPTPERERIRALVTFLEDRRVLFNPHDLEVEGQVITSVTEIRRELTKILSDLSEDSKAVPSIRAMRAACRRFLDEPHAELRLTIPRLYRGGDPGFFIALGELRAVFGTQLAFLALQYGIDIEGDLAAIVPSEDESERRGD